MRLWIIRGILFWRTKGKAGREGRRQAKKCPFTAIYLMVSSWRETMASVPTQLQ